METDRWPGAWLWPARASSPPSPGLFEAVDRVDNPDRNTFCRFRATFYLERRPAEARLWLSADGRYLALLNGERIGRGPAASDADVREVDAYDVSSRLKLGANVVAVLVHAYGVDTAWYTRPSAKPLRAHGAGALYAHLDVDGEARLTTAAAWRCQRASDWDPSTPRVNNALGFVESRDTRREPAGWETVGFDDAHWEPPEHCEPPTPLLGTTYFPVLRARGIPNLVEEAIQPAGYTPAEVIESARDDAGEVLLRVRDERPLPLDQCRVQNMRVRTSPGRAVRLVYDFGRLVAGRPRVVVDGTDGAVLDLVTSESPDSDGQPLVDVFGSRHGHRFVLRDGLQELERWDWLGFRYLFLTVRAAQTAEVAIREVTCTSFDDPTAVLGDFACSDPCLTGIWQAGARTLGLGMKDIFATDVAREQRQWLGDLQAATASLLAVYGAAPLLRQSLRQVGEAEPIGGLLPMFAPGDYRERWTTIPDYTLRWVLAVDEHQAWTGDDSLAHEVYPAVLRSMRAFEPYATGDGGLLQDLPFWRFVDWAAVGRDGLSAPLNGLYLLALDAARRVAAAVGHASEARRFRERASTARRAFRDQFWWAEGDVFVDGSVSSGGGPISQHANALAILAGVTTGRRSAALAQTLADPARLRVTAYGRIVPAEDADPGYEPTEHLVLAQPGFMGFVLSALETAGRAHLGLKLIRRLWGPMVESGTCWETWSGRHSRCHPWATAPTAALPRILLGVHRVGDNQVEIAPTYPDPDIAWARGRVPLPSGEALGVGWKRSDHGVDLTVEVPSGVTARLPGGRVVKAGTHTSRQTVR